MHDFHIFSYLMPGEDPQKLISKRKNDGMLGCIMTQKGMFILTGNKILYERSNGRYAYLLGYALHVHTMA